MADKEPGVGREAGRDTGRRADQDSRPGEQDEPPVEVWDAVDQLYSLPPAEFVGRRSELAEQARQAGAKDAAKQIAALRKPTVSAWTVNTLSRTRPQLVTDLLALGDQMRRAQRTLDGSQLRELSKQRRQVLDALAREAFAVSGLQPSPSVQEEVVATLAAALADPQTGAAVQAGSLVKAARADGFGEAARPELALVGTPPTDRTRRKAGSEPARAGGRKPDPEAGQAEREAELRAKQEAEQLAEREAELQAERAYTDRLIAAARADLEKARAAERGKADRLQDLERQVATARQALDEARFAVRRFEAELADAERRRKELG